MNLIPEWLSEGFSALFSGLKEPMFRSQPTSRFSLNLTKAQEQTVAKVGVVAVAIAGFAVGAALVARAWTGNWGFRKEVKEIKAPSLLPQATGTKESVFTPVHIVAKVKALFSDKMVPFIAGVAALTGATFLFARLDQVTKLALRK